MTMPFEGVQSQTVDMLPALNLQWEKVHLDAERLDVYVAPECPRELIDVVIYCAYEQPSNLPIAGLGDFSRVYKYAESAVKVGPLSELHRAGVPGGGVSNLVANVALREGLALIDQSSSSSLPSTKCMFRAPEIRAVAIPEYDGCAARNIAWAMEYIDGTVPASTDVPAPEDRRALYRSAMDICGITPDHYVLFDDIYPDGRPKNLLVESSTEGESVSVVKFDIMALSNILPQPIT